MSTIMAIEVRNHNGKKQYRFRCYYQDMYGNRKQKNSKWYETKKEAQKQESLLSQHTTIIIHPLSFMIWH